MRNHDGKRTAALCAAGAVAWLCVMFFFAGQSGVESSSLSEGFTMSLFGWLVRMGVSFDALHWYIRKIAHAAIFAVEGCLLGSALLGWMKTRRAVTISALSCAAIAALNELWQMTSEGRSCRFTDVLIDSAGALVGIALAVAVLHAFRQLPKK